MNLKYFFGDTPQLRVFDFLIENYFFDFPMTEISKGSNVSYNSLKTFFPKLLSSGILIKTRRIGKSNYYKFNTENIFVKDLIKLDWMLVKKDLALVQDKLQLALIDSNLNE
jgi:predicted transcriptional regulator